MDKITSGDITALFEALHATFRDKRDELIALDAKVGDSDLGITMNAAFEAAAATVAAQTDTPMGKQFMLAGAAMAKAAPSTMGTLTATGFMRGGKALGDADAIGATEMAAFWRAYADGIAERGKAKLGTRRFWMFWYRLPKASKHRLQRDCHWQSPQARHPAMPRPRLRPPRTLLRNMARQRPLPRKAKVFRMPAARSRPF